MISNSTFSTKSLTRAGIIGALYVALTLALAPLSYGAIQVRIAEGLTLLPLLFPESVYGLTIGCLIANLFGNGVLDIVFGTLATFLAGILTRVFAKKLKKDWLKISIGGIFPVVINALIIPFTFYALSESFIFYLICVGQIFLGQALSVYLVGTPIYLAIKKGRTKIRP